MTFGGNGDARGAGGFQIVPVTPGRAYTLTVDAGAENWWLPTGEIRIIWLDTDGSSELARATAHTTGSIHDPDRYDVGVPTNRGASAPRGPTRHFACKNRICQPRGHGLGLVRQCGIPAFPRHPVAAGGHQHRIHGTCHPSPVGLHREYRHGILLRIDLMGGTSGTEYWIQTTTDLALFSALGSVAGEQSNPGSRRRRVVICDLQFSQLATFLPCRIRGYVIRTGHWICALTTKTNPFSTYPGRVHFLQNYA